MAENKKTVKLTEEKLMNMIYEAVNRAVNKNKKANLQEKRVVSENTLNSLISESIKKHLNEISSGMLDMAYNSAEDQGRWNQSDSFRKERNDRFRLEVNPYNVPNLSIYWDSIGFKSAHGDDITVLEDGKVYVGQEMGTLDEKLKAIRTGEIKTKDKRAARVIANWCGRRLNPSIVQAHPEVTDYHTWCAL